MLRNNFHQHLHISQHLHAQKLFNTAYVKNEVCEMVKRSLADPYKRMSVKQLFVCVLRKLEIKSATTNMQPLQLASHIENSSFRCSFFFNDTKVERPFFHSSARQCFDSQHFYLHFQVLSACVLEQRLNCIVESREEIKTWFCTFKR